MDTVQFLTIGKPDIYLLKSLSKSATVFIGVTSYRNWLQTYLIFAAIDIFWLTNIWRLYIYRLQ